MIQSSLDTLRAARPDYTPRVGHVWPIVEAPTTSKLLGKPPGGTRQNSVVPGTPMDASQQSKSQQQQQPPDSSVKPPQDNEEKQVWEPFAYAFQATRIEMERKRQAAAAAALANSVGGGPGGGASGSGISAEGMGQVGTEQLARVSVILRVVLAFLSLHTLDWHRWWSVTRDSHYNYSSWR
jgi:hypothetical protein